jgi:hypothetical protein
MDGVGIGLFFVFWLAFVFGGLALWIWALVDVVKLPDHAYRAAGKEKVTWILVVALVGFVGAIIWWLAARKDVHTALAANPYPPFGGGPGYPTYPGYPPAPPVGGPPPGWYPDPSGAPGTVWWDGTRWTDHRQG